ncbi:hypothetical protein BRADI_3g09495v3, partial [Brachypodium distachyon]
DIADTARTTILSRRWKQIPAMLSKVVITDAVRANTTMLEATRSTLESRVGSPYTIHLMRMQFYLGDEYIFIGQTVANIIATQKMRKNCTNDDLLTYGRQLMSFFDACPNTFGGLTRLELENLRLGESDFPKIFSISKQFEFLSLYHRDMGILSLMEVEHPQLCELEIKLCSFERVELKWLPKLILLTVSAFSSRHVPLYFGYVPLLQRLSELLGKAAISNLHLNFQSEKIWVKPEDRFVSLINISGECDLNWTMFILQGAPILKELCITVRDHLCEMEKDKGLEWETSESDFKNHNLAVLRIFGFQAEDKFISYVRSVMKAAVNLEDVYLLHNNNSACRRCKHMIPKAWTLKQRLSLREKNQ